MGTLQQHGTQEIVRQVKGTAACCMKHCCSSNEVNDGGIGIEFSREISD